MRLFQLLKSSILAIAFLGLILTINKFIADINADGPVGFLEPHKSYLSAGALILLGIPTVEIGCKWLGTAQNSLSIPPEISITIRYLVRIVGYGVIITSVVAIVTGNAVAGLTAGGFAGMVAGFATQSVLGNLVAGLFIVILRPIGVEDNVTIRGYTGKVSEIRLMFTVLDSGDQEVFIPSKDVLSTILIKNKPTD